MSRIISISDGFSTIRTTGGICGESEHDEHTIQCLPPDMHQLTLDRFKYAREQHAWKSQGWKPWPEIEFGMYFPEPAQPHKYPCCTTNHACICGDRP